MAFILEAACLSNPGKVRNNNEDNFFFNGLCLEADNDGLKHPYLMTKKLYGEVCVAIFDGMGGENYGEIASFAAADCLKNASHRLNDYLIPKQQLLYSICQKINDTVVKKQQELCTDHMGTTMVSLCFSHSHVYVCNIGDSRAYRYREGEFMQLSVDHIEKREGYTKKASLTQHLGISPDYFLIEPYLAKEKLRPGDQYLLCSDGLTDMLSDFEIAEILNETESAAKCVQRLVETALDKGGRDNITVIVGRIR